MQYLLPDCDRGIAMKNNGYHPEPVQEMPAWMAEQDNYFAPPPRPPANLPVAQATEPAPLPATTRFKRSSLASLINRPPKEWIIENVIGAGDLCMIYGAPGCGKTFVVIDMIFAACLGQQFAMRFDVARPLTVAYAAGEGLGGLPQRYASGASFYGVEDLTNFIFFEDIPQLYDLVSPTGAQSFVEEWKLDPQPLDVLIVDTLHSATAGADENSSQDMGIVLQSCKYLRDQLGCAVILVHHTNKNGTAERGSSSLRGAMDCMIEIKRINDTSTKAALQCEKLKDGEAWGERIFDLVESGESVRVWWYEDSESAKGKGQEDARKTITNFMTAQPGKKFTAKMLGEVAGTTHTNTIYHLSKMVSEGVCSSELMDTDKQPSSRNPLTYFILQS